MTAPPSTLFVVPTLGRRPNYLRESIGSVIAQDVPLDLVVVAPKGRGVETVAEEYGARFVEDPGSGGLSGALNAGLAAGDPAARYFAWLGDDDLLTRASLARTTAALEQRADAVLAYGWCDYINGDGKVIFRNRAGRLAGIILGWGPNLVPQPGSLMRLDAVRAVGGLDESIHLAMDLDLFLKLREHGPLVALNSTVAQFRWHADSATVSGGSVSMEESDQLRMRKMSTFGAYAYRYLRWPGRLALWLAKRYVDRKSVRLDSR